MDIMRLYLPMDKQEVEKPTQCLEKTRRKE